MAAIILQTMGPVSTQIMVATLESEGSWLIPYAANSPALYPGVS